MVTPGIVVIQSINATTVLKGKMQTLVFIEEASSSSSPAQNFKWMEQDSEDPHEKSK